MAKPTSTDIPASGWEQFESFQLAHLPPMGRVLAHWCIGLFGLLVGAVFLPWTQNIRSSGTLTTLQPQDRPQTVHSTIAGRIEKWLVQEGQRVKKGDTLVVLSEVKEKYFDPQLLSRLQEQIKAKEGALQATQGKGTALTTQIAALKDGLQLSLQKARNKVRQSQLKVQSDSADLAASGAEYEIAKGQLARQEKLFQQGLKSLTELESRKLKFQEVQAKLLATQNKRQISQNELLNARIELSSLEAEYLDKISKAQSDRYATRAYAYDTESEISKMRNEYANLQIRSSFYQITAPQDGYVVQALKAGIGETLKEGEAICSSIPVNPQLAVQLYVKPMDVPLLRKGRKVRLQFDGWPALVFSGWPNAGFGTFGGEVAVIDNIGSEGKYRILVVPDPQEEPWPEAIRVGSGAYGWSMLNDVPIWYELWRQLNGFLPDYVNGPVTNEKKAEKSKGNPEEPD